MRESTTHHIARVKTPPTEEEQVSKLQKASIGAAGEHYVFARLSAQGYVAGLAPENTKDLDIITMARDGTRSIQIQVKAAIVKGKVASVSWPMKRKHEDIVAPNLVYVFVAMPHDWTDSAQPETFMIPAVIVSAILKKSHADWLKARGVHGQKHNDTDMRMIKSYYKDSPSIPADWMNAYRNNWSALDSD